MTANIHNAFSLGKFGEFVFARQTPCLAAERHPSLRGSFKSWRRRRAAERELSRLTDRELADIGVSRDNIGKAVRTK